MLEFDTIIKNKEPIEGGTPAHEELVRSSNRAMRITSELNRSYHTPEEVRGFFEELTGKQIDESFFCFPPFYTDFGYNCCRKSSKSMKRTSRRRTDGII